MTLCLDDEFGDLVGDNSSDGTYYELVEGETDDDLLMSEFVIEEDEIEVEDCCLDKIFEDCLDGSSTLDRL